MRLVATHIARLAHVVLTAELSTRHQFRGMGRSNPDLQQIAYQMMRDELAPRHYRETAADCLVIAEAVWWDYMKPHITRMLVDKWGADEREAASVVERYFVDDSPQYDPSPRRRRNG